MTFEKWISQYLEDSGLFDQSARDAVLAAMKADSEGLATMHDRWTDKVAGYQPQFLQVIRYVTDQAAVKWIDENMPDHFARPIFARDIGSL